MRESQLAKKLDRYLGIPLLFALGLLLRCRDFFRAGSRPAPRRILVSKLSAVGDTVLLVPALRALRRQHPHARVTFLCSAINREVIARFPCVDGRPLVEECVLWDLAASLKRPRRLLALLALLRRQRFDLTIDFEQWIRATALVSALLAAPRRLGFRTPRQGRLYAFTDTDSARPQQHEVRNFLSLVALLGPVEDDGVPALSLPTEAQDWACDRLPQRTGGPLIAFHPGCGAIGRPREWPAVNYGALGAQLVAKHNAQIVLTGGPSERLLAESIRQLIGPAATVVAGATTLTQFAALLQQCDLLVCGNTGAMHLAAAVGTPTVALHGPTNPNKWGPVGPGHTVIQSPIHCSPCLDLGHEYGCTDYPCMPLIQVDTVLQAVTQALTMNRGDTASAPDPQP